VPKGLAPHGVFSHICNRAAHAVTSMTLLLHLTLACSGPAPTVASPPLRLGACSSFTSSGLSDALVPLFEEEIGLSVEVQAVGTGAALSLARAGEVDVVLTHSREAENRFVQEGFGVNWRQVMFNDFILVGPDDDPAGVRGKDDIIEIFKAIAAERAPFVSRGDNGGMHLRELQIWEQAGIEPGGDWYSAPGVNLMDALRLADERNAYTLTDSSSWLFRRDEFELAVLSQGDQRLQNVYSVMAVNPTKVEDVHFESAMAFVDFLTSQETQLIIQEHGIQQFGSALFKPLALAN
jgi:tungstate transport system substrate-binding protein